MPRKTLLMTLLLTALTFALRAPAAPTGEYEQLEGKATRFFNNQEWASANAMYLLMLEQRPRIASTYARAAVSDIMAGDTIQALDFVARSGAYEVSLDSLLSDIRTVSFSIGRGDLYEHYLLDLKRYYPWLGRVADNYLMRYYAFRQNGPELIKYARTMLSGLPDNQQFLRMLACGQMLDGRTASAIDTWKKIIALYPDDYDTVLDLANCYDALDNRSDALTWMRRAAEIRPTPYVEQRIAALTTVRKPD